VVSRPPDSDIGVPLLRQAWRHVAFLHWRYPASVIRPHVPAPLSVAEYDGSAWVTMTPLLMDKVRPVGAPALPLLSRFPETNLRTYVTGPDGEEGVWFFSLDAASTWITIGARLVLGAPYIRSALKIQINDGNIDYSGRRLRRVHRYAVTIRAGEVRPPADQDLWFLNRWRAFTSHLGKVLAVPVHHEPWPLRDVAVVSSVQTLTEAVGLPPTGDPPLAHFSDGVNDVTFGRPRILRTT
jgi:uncharacterized protein YqjF (DUF2071 family)